jgi:hypothetical protein
MVEWSFVKYVRRGYRMVASESRLEGSPIRGRWQIENQCHSILDAVFKEDQTSIPQTIDEAVGNWTWRGKFIDFIFFKLTVVNFV